jgi:pimeloyl-ACP methyl ester carboxylesterase
VAAAITMPRLGLSMVEGTVIEWRVRPGDSVTKGEVILTIESEKAEVEVEAFASGVLTAVYADVGTTVPVGALLGAIAAPGETFDREAFAARFAAPSERPIPPKSALAVSTKGGLATGDAPHGRGMRGARSGVAIDGAGIKAAPAARALARRLGVDLAALTGTGPGGRITVSDVERASEPGVTVDGARLAVATDGLGPPLLFICGYGVDASGWRLQVEALRSVCKVVTYDHRGVGRSGPLGGTGLTIGQLAEDAHALLAHLRLLPAVVVGSSLGAAVALELSLAHPDAVRALVLLAPPLRSDGRLAAVLSAWCEYEEPCAETRIRAMLPWLFGREFLAHAGKREAAAATLRAMAAKTPAETLRQHAGALLGWLGSRAADLGRVTAPALVVVGSDDVLTTPDEAEALARGLPKARLEVFTGAGHAVMIERAAALNQLLSAFATGGTSALPAGTVTHGKDDPDRTRRLG